MPDGNAKYFNQLIGSVNIPFTNDFTDEAQMLYERGNDMILMYRGDPDVLRQALQLYALTGNDAYFFAGAASVQQAASYVSGGQYDNWGTQQARKLFRQGQQRASRRFEIDVFEPDFVDATDKRDVLDNLKRYPEAQYSIRLALAEMRYYGDRKDLPRVEVWYETCIERAENDLQRLYAINKMAGIHLDIGSGAGSLPYYELVVTINPADPWAWHNMSIVHLKHGNLDRAGYCNRRALDVMEFGAAQGILAALIKEWGRNKHEDPLTDVPRYPMSEEAAMGWVKQQKGLGKKLGKLLGN